MGADQLASFFQDLEKWDLDKILHGLGKQDDDRSWTAEIAFPSTDHGEQIT